MSEETGGEYSLYETTAPPQLGAPPHIHHRETEAFYVLEGEFEFLKGERTVRARVGEFVRVPRGVVHGFTNVGDEPARLLGIVTPGGLHEKMLAEIGEQAKAETLPPPPEGSPDMTEMETAMETALSYVTECYYLLLGIRLYREVTKVLSKKVAGVKTPATAPPCGFHRSGCN